MDFNFTGICVVYRGSFMPLLSTNDVMTTWRASTASGRKLVELVALSYASTCHTHSWRTRVSNERGFGSLGLLTGWHRRSFLNYTTATVQYPLPGTESCTAVCLTHQRRDGPRGEPELGQVLIWRHRRAALLRHAGLLGPGVV